MGKRRWLWLVSAVSLWLGLTEPLAAHDAAARYFGGAGRKLGRGVANVVTAPLELAREPFLVKERDGMIASLSIGVVRGIGMTVVRAAAGVIEAVTFPIPIPKNFEPLLKPEFVYAHGNWQP